MQCLLLSLLQMHITLLHVATLQPNDMSSLDNSTHLQAIAPATCEVEPKHDGVKKQET